MTRKLFAELRRGDMTRKQKQNPLDVYSKYQEGDIEYVSSKDEDEVRSSLMYSRSPYRSSVNDSDSWGYGSFSDD